jgi:hypothetical protein
MPDANTNPDDSAPDAPEPSYELIPTARLTTDLAEQIERNPGARAYVASRITLHIGMSARVINPLRLAPGERLRTTDGDGKPLPPGYYWTEQYGAIPFDSPPAVTPSQADVPGGMGGAAVGPKGELGGFNPESNA